MGNTGIPPNIQSVVGGEGFVLLASSLQGQEHKRQGSKLEVSPLCGR